MADTSCSSDEAGRLAAVRRYEILDTPPDGAFDCVAELAARIFAVPIALISIVDSDRIWFKSHYGVATSQVDREPGLCTSAILRDAPTVITDAKMDVRTLANSLVAGAFGLRFYAAAPLHTTDGFNLGTLCVIDKAPRIVTEAEQETLRSLAAIVVNQLELRLSARRLTQSEASLRAGMEETIAARTAQLSRLSRELFRIAEEERGRLAGELHDDMGSTLTLLAMKLEDIKAHMRDTDPRSLATHREAVQLLHDLVASQRHVVDSLRPRMLDSLGLAAALQTYADDWGRKSGIAVIAVIPVDLPALETDAALAIYRVAQESLTNVAKHANATAVRLTLTVAGDDITLCVEDDGIGLAPAQVPHRSSHGILGMHERLLQFGGWLVVEPGQDQRGTRVMGAIPANRAVAGAH